MERATLCIPQVLYTFLCSESDAYDMNFNDGGSFFSCFSLLIF